MQNAEPKNVPGKQAKNTKDESKKDTVQEQNEGVQGAEEQKAGDQSGTSENQTGDQNADQTSQSQPAQDVGVQNQSDQNQDNAALMQSEQKDVRYYTVKKGDSLMSISKAVYHTTQKVQDICNANQIENMDMIYEGQQLLLP